MTGCTRFLAALWIGMLLGLASAPGRAADEAQAPPLPAARNIATAAADEPADAPATLRILNRDIVTLRARFHNLTPQQRVQRAQQRLRELPVSATMDPINVSASNIGDAKGTVFLLGDRPLFGLLDADVDPESRQSHADLVRQTRTRLEEVQKAWIDSHDRALLLRGLARTVAAIVVLGLLIWGTYRVSRIAVAWMERKRDVIAAVHPYVDWREFLARLAVGTMQLLQWLVLLTLAYAWLVFVLASFAATEPIANSLGDWLWGKVTWIAEGLLESLPGMVTVLMVLVLTRAVADVMRYFFDMLQQGRLQLPAFHPETVTATRRIFTFIVWGMGLAVAYPYLPGSNSDAFKGVSVLFGVMITLGSTGIVTQAMSGLVIVYSRAIRKGDFVDINGVQGVVSEIASLATKVVTVRNEEITIPNSVVVANPIHNYSKLGGTQGTLLTTKVTIGYDAPWRQVHELLIGAARRTARVRASPEPYVFQRALSDFYVEYELFCSIDEAQLRIPILSDLHAAIQDAFNEAGCRSCRRTFSASPTTPWWCRRPGGTQRRRGNPWAPKVPLRIEGCGELQWPVSGSRPSPG
jgi:small-conductance mechanosensitive channel